MDEKAKPVIIRDKENDKEYTLEFNRDSIKFAEGRGFKIDDMDYFPMSKVPEFFWYAFRMHHPNFALNQAEKLLDRMGGMSEPLARRLGELWAVPFAALTGNSGDEKNASVTVEL